MSNDIQRALTELSSRLVTSRDPSKCDVAYSDLFALYSAIRSAGDTPLHGAFVEVTLRILEMSILRDPKIRNLASRWNALSGDARSLIAKRVQEIAGAEPPNHLVEHLVKIIGGTASRHGRRQTDYSAYVPTLFEHIADTHPKREVRCAVCGYHFRLQDLGFDRQNIAKGYGLSFSKHYEARRAENRDRWKPIFSVTDERKYWYTTLTIDHIVPEEGMGWSGTDNLEVLCRFCNAGKMAYRWALEPVSLFGAGGLADYPDTREINRLMQTTVVSAFRFHSSGCAKCSRKAARAELTVRPRLMNLDSGARALAPWNLIAYCYACVPTS